MLEFSNGNGKKVKKIYFNYEDTEVNPENLFGYINCNRYNVGEYYQVKNK